MTSSVVSANVGHTKQWRLKHAVKISAQHTRRRSPSATNPKRPKSTCNSSPAAGHPPGPSSNADPPRNAPPRNRPTSGPEPPPRAAPTDPDLHHRGSWGHPLHDPACSTSNERRAHAVTVELDAGAPAPEPDRSTRRSAAPHHRPQINAELDRRSDVTLRRLPVEHRPLAIGRSPSPSTNAAAPL